MSQVHHTQSIQYLLPYEKLLPHHFDLFLQIANSYHSSYEYHKAIIYYKKAEKIGSLDNLNLKDFAWCFRKTEAFRKALLYYQKAGQFEKHSVWEIKQIAFCYRELQDWDNALKYYLKATKLDPGNTWYLDNAGFCCQRLKKYKQALNLYHKSREIDAQDAWNLRQTGFCYQKLKNYDKALEFHLSSQEVDPHDTWNTGCIGWCFFVLGDLDKARNCLKQCLDNGEDEYDLLNLGHVFLCKGEVAEAKKYYRKSLVKFNKLNKFIENFEEDAFYVTEQYKVKSEEYMDIKSYLLQFWQQKFGKKQKKT